MGYFQTSKQIPESLPELHAPRTRLLQTFDRATKNQYIYVQAPAGYGKTTSTLLWLKKINVKYIWISLDTYDNTPLIFYKLLCTSLLNVIPFEEEVIQFLKSPTFNATPIECTIDLFSQLLYKNNKYVLVFDDFHSIKNSEIKKSLPYVLKRLPVTFSIVILSRNSLSESELSLYGAANVSHIGINELLITSDEIRRHFANYGRFITKAESEEIEKYTEGWIIAINMMAASGNVNVSKKSHNTSIKSFIEQNIWNRLDPELQTFLMKTSVPDSFSLELCEQLTEDKNCKEKLDFFISSNINISPIGSEYRYHNLFLDFLREKLLESDIHKTILNKRVTDYYLKKGDFLTAKKYAMNSGDMISISHVIRSFYSIKTFSLDEYVEFNRLYRLHNIPNEICDKMPLLYIARIFFAYLTGDIKELNQLIDKLFPVINIISERYPESLENATSILLMDCRIKLSEFDHYTEDLPKVKRFHTALQSPTFTFQLPFLHRCARDFYAILDPKAMKNVRAFSENIIKDNTDIMFKGAEAGLLMERNELHEALELALNLENTINDKMSPEFVYAIYVLIAEIYLMMRQKTKHEITIREVKDYINTTSSQYLLKNLSAYESRTIMLNGDKSAAELWLKNYYINDNSFCEFYKIYRNFTTVRAYILLNQMNKAIDALNQLKTLSNHYDRLLDWAEAEILLTIIHWVSGNKKEAQNLLLEVLNRLQPYGFIRLIANEGSSLVPILSSLLKKIKKEPSRSEHFYNYINKVYIATYEQSKYFKGLTYNKENIMVKLSPQQKYILELLANGHKNAEIVELTGLSLNTIRTHTKITYRKLEVNNVLDAIVKARELGIIK